MPRDGAVAGVFVSHPTRRHSSGVATKNHCWTLMHRCLSCPKTWAGMAAGQSATPRLLDSTIETVQPQERLITEWTGVCLLVVLSPFSSRTPVQVTGMRNALCRSWRGQLFD